MPIRFSFTSAVIALVFFTIALRLPALIHPRPIDDEAVYSVVANEIVDGGRPYIDAVERKPPLLFWTYAAIFKAAGKYNWAALHAVAVAWTIATMAGLFVIGKNLFDRNIGLMAAFLYALFQPWGTANNLAFNGELLMNLPIVCACALAFRRSGSRLRPEMIAAGALIAAAFLLKQPAGIAIVALGIYPLLPAYRKQRNITVTTSGIHVALLLVGFVGLLAGVVAILHHQHILHEAVYWTILDHGIAYVFVRAGIFYTLAFIAACLPLIVGAALAFSDKDGIWQNNPAERSALFGLLLVSVIGTGAAARFHPHYYIQLIPPLALLAAPHLQYLIMGGDRSMPRILRRSSICGYFALAVVVFTISHWSYLAQRRERSVESRYLTEHSAPNDRIFVWGWSAAKIYADAQRRPACRYILTAPLTGYIFGNLPLSVDTRYHILPGAWETLEKDFAVHPPKYIVDRERDAEARYPVRDFPVLEKLLREHYEPITSTATSVIYRLRPTE